MRFSTDIIFADKTSLNIPTNYRRDVLSLFKEALKRMSPELYDQLWGDKKANSSKPFTFCISLPNAQSIKEKDKNYLKISSGGSNLSVRLTISSSDPIILINFYNALLNISGYKLFGSDIELKHFRLLQEIPFNEKVSTFKTMSPMVVRNMDVRNNKEKEGLKYLTSDDIGFENNLYHSVRGMCKDFLDSGYDLKMEDFKFSKIDCRIEKIYHYKEVIPATSGTFKIEAPEEILKLIFDAGIGARRSQGFGIMDVVK